MDLLFDDPCIVFALHREAAPFYRTFRPQQRFPGAPCRARFCGPEWLTTLVLETGIGSEQTEAALRWALSRPLFGNVPYRPKLVLAAGFCGALGEHAVGDVILATEVIDSEGCRQPTSWPQSLPPGKWHPPLHRAGLLSLPRLVTSPEEKRTLGQQFAAAAVDMESATIARLCARHDIPFGCMRAISDDRSTALSPRLISLLSGERISAIGLVVALATRPVLARELWRLARNTKIAADQLAQALGELLTLTLPFGHEL